MKKSLNWVSFFTILNREIKRFTRIWTQTLLPPVINQSLYFIVFGSLIGSQLRSIEVIPYMAFIVPGLVMMSIITSSFMNVVSSFYSSKFIKNIEEVMVSPTPKWVLMAGYVGGGMARGLAVGLIVFSVSAFFTAPVVQFPLVVILFALVTASLFALAGLTMAIFAKSFDDVGFVPTFILTPLTYLGGVFYSIKDLPEFWQAVSKLNPIFYMIDGFRYGFYGIGDLNIWISILVLFLFTLSFVMLNLWLLKKGVRIKS